MQISGNSKFNCDLAVNPVGGIVIEAITDRCLNELYT